MKKVCFITTVPTTIETFILPLCYYLHNNTDWDISFICDYDENFRNSIPDYVHYYPVSMKRGISLSGIASMNEMRKIFKREKFDLIQYSTPNASLYASIAGFLARIPVRLYCQWGMVYIAFSGLKRQIFKLEETFVCALSTWIEPDSHSNLQFAHSEGLYPKRKGSVIWNGSACGVNTKKFDISKKTIYRDSIRNKLNISDGDFVFGFVGRVTTDKGINELFQAYKNILDKYPQSQLVLVGEEEFDDRLDHSLLEWSMSCPSVHYCGNTDVVEQYLSAMDCYVLPSYREGFGMSVIEAEAMGVPVVVTRIPGPIDAMEENITGLLCEKGDIVSLQNAMEYLLNDRDKRLEFGKAGHVFASQNFEQSILLKKIKEDRERLFIQ